MLYTSAVMILLELLGELADFLIGGENPRTKRRWKIVGLSVTALIILLVLLATMNMYGYL